MPGLGGQISATLHLPAQRGERVAVVIAALLLAAGARIGVRFGAQVLAERFAAAGGGDQLERTPRGGLWAQPHPVGNRCS